MLSSTDEKKYSVIKGAVTVEGVTHITYGIKCGRDAIHDISVDLDFVKEIAKTLPYVLKIPFSPYSTALFNQKACSVFLIIKSLYN